VEARGELIESSVRPPPHPFCTCGGGRLPRPRPAPLPPPSGFQGSAGRLDAGRVPPPHRRRRGLAGLRLPTTAAGRRGGAAAVGWRASAAARILHAPDPANRARASSRV